MKKETAVQKKAEEQAALFKALADPTRLKLVKILCHQHEPDALCVNALAGLLGITQSAVSQHLRILKNVGIVMGKRRGYHIHYYLNNKSLKRYQKLISDALQIEDPH